MLEGLPEFLKRRDGSLLPAGPYPEAQKAAEAYAYALRLDYVPLKTYKPVDRRRAAFIAAEWDRMAHAPNDPTVIRSYKALKDETLAQYNVMLLTGLKVELFNGSHEENPYGRHPVEALFDIVACKHLWIEASERYLGDGDLESQAAFSANPLLDVAPVLIGGKRALYNDVFRAVHDYFGHAKEGVGFFSDGEENAWRGHATLYTREALGALTTELRGQNCWVNFGPYGQRSRRTGKYQYGDQKVGLLPAWCWDDGRLD